MKKWFIVSLMANVLIVSAALVMAIQKSDPPQQTNMEAATIMESNEYKSRRDMLNALPTKKQSIVFLGDSHTERCEWGELFQNATVINRGIDGDTTEGLLRRIHDITKIKPDSIFIMIGINDILANTPTAKTIENYRQVIETIRRESPDTKLYLQSVLPIAEPINQARNSDIAALNNEIQKLAQAHNAAYINLYDSFYTQDGLNKTLHYDGLHLNGKGYLLWRDRIKNYVG